MEYRDFLENLDIITEAEFNEILNSFPTEDIKNLSINDFYWDANMSCNEIAGDIFDKLLDKWDSVFVDSIDFDKREVELWDVQSIDDLNEIVKYFKEWDISNYDSLKEELGEIEKEDISIKEKETLLNKFKLLDIDTLKQIWENYDKK